MSSQTRLRFPFHMQETSWKDPAVVSEETGCKGDGDPLDVVEIGSRHECKNLNCAACCP